jgi:hypothetical protein
VDAGFEIAVSREHRGHVEVVFFDGFFDGGVQGPLLPMQVVQPKGRQMKAQGVQGGHETGILQVVDDHFGAGCQRGFDKRRHFEAAGDGIFGHQAGAEEHVGIGGVGAGGDGGHHHVAVADGGLGAVDLDGRKGAGRPGCTCVWRAWYGSRIRREGGDVGDFGVAVVVAAEDFGKGVLQIVEANAVLGPGRAGQGGHDRRQVQLHHLGILGSVSPV